MGQAEKQPDNKKQDIVSRFKSEYADAVATARVSAEHTATAGWQNLYAFHQAKMDNNRTALAKSLRNLADRLDVRALSEEEDKEFGELKKDSISMRDTDAIFIQETVDPVRESVRFCDSIIFDAKSKARRDEQEAPLVNVGLEEVMKQAIASVPKVSWDNETGRVIIEEL